MECNKDEGLRAKEIAEKNFMAKDLAGAKKFALKAQSLCPSLEGIDQLITTLDVYLASEIEVHGGKDWYAIMRVDASADDETLKKQYRKLALQVHPDKNKSIGAEGAFHLISQAWSVLSNKTKRLLYDQKRKIKEFQQKTSQTNKDDNVLGTANRFYDFANSVVAASNPHPPHQPSKVNTFRPPQPPPPPPQPSKAKTFCPEPPPPPPPPPLHSSKPNTFRTPPRPPPPPQPSKPNTFWASCKRCTMQFKYLRIYLNHNLLCPNCHEPFLASEIPNGPNPSASQQRQQNSNHNTSSTSGSGATGFHHGAGVHHNLYNSPNFQWGPFPSAAGAAASATAPSVPIAQAANMLHRIYEKASLKRNACGSGKLNRGSNDSVPTKKRRGFGDGSGNLKRGSNDSVPTKKRRGIGDGSGNLKRGSNDSVPTKKRRGIGKDDGGDHGGVQTGQMGASEMERVDEGTMDFLKSRTNFKQFNFGMEFSQLDIWKILIEKTKVTIGKKLEEWKSSAAAKMEEKENKKKKQKLNKNDEKKLNQAIYGNRNQDMLVDCQSKRKPAMRKKGSSNDLKANSGKGVSGSVSIDVPDPDFHDFDKDRTEKSFQGEQIWATYDDEDGMPRYYMLVRQVISLKPFKIYVSFLTSRTNSEFGQLNWVNSGFTKSCGDFRVGRYEIKDTINIFSHRVRFEKGPRGIIKIIPRKGEIWALYKNWSAEWDKNTPDEVIHQYDMVEILDDYSEEQGASVIPLVKVAGFKAVFCQHRDPREVKRVSREEMFRFSHQVPSYIMTGEEAQNAPKGCHELDPAAIPLELLKVITDSQEEDKVMESAENQSVSTDF